MTSILPWLAGAWMLVIMFVFALLGMSSKQDRAADDEQIEAAVRALSARWKPHSE